MSEPSEQAAVKYVHGSLRITDEVWSDRIGNFEELIFAPRRSPEPDWRAFLFPRLARMAERRRLLQRRWQAAVAGWRYPDDEADW